MGLDKVPISDINEVKCLQRAQKILQDNTHHSHSLYPLPYHQNIMYHILHSHQITAMCHALSILSFWITGSSPSRETRIYFKEQQFFSGGSWRLRSLLRHWFILHYFLSSVTNEVCTPLLILEHNGMQLNTAQFKGCKICPANYQQYVNWTHVHTAVC